MFSQKTKSFRIKSDTTNGANAATENASSNTTTASSSSSSTSKGLLSFNTSNFTKLLKNSTNFVQSTFGSGGGGAQASASTPLNASVASTSTTAHSSYGNTPEQSFTIPSIKKRNDASNYGAAKKERDILSTPILIQPVSMTNASPLSNLSSYKKFSATNDETLSTSSLSVTIANNTLSSNGLQKSQKPSKPIASITASNVSTTPSPPTYPSNQHQKLATTNREQISIESHTPNNSNNKKTESPIPQQTATTSFGTSKIQQQKPQTVSIAPQTVVTPKKTSNANILFETMKISKTSAYDVQTSSSSSLSSSTKAHSSNSNAISSTAPHEFGNKCLSHSSDNKMSTKNAATKNDVDRITRNEQRNNTYDSGVSIDDEMANELTNAKKRYENDGTNPNDTNVSMYSRTKAFITTSNLPAIISSNSYFSSASTDPTIHLHTTTETTKPSAPNINSHPNYYNLINDDGTKYANSKTMTNNIFEAGKMTLSNGSCTVGSTTLNRTLSNNNFDYNLDDERTNSGSSNKLLFESDANKFQRDIIGNSSSALPMYSNQNSDNAKPLENIYANCVMMPTKTMNLDNYQSSQQDTNENVIIAGAVNSNSARILNSISADIPNNNINMNINNNHSNNNDYSINNNVSTDSFSAFDNNIQIKTDTSTNISIASSSSSLLTNSTATSNISQNSSSSSSGSGSGNNTTESSGSTTTTTTTTPSKSAQNYFQNALLSKSNELFDILEEISDEDDHHHATIPLRFNRWNSSSSLYEQSTAAQLTQVSASSYAAAAAFANELNQSNRNPFLQLIAATSTQSLSATEALTIAMSATTSIVSSVTGTITERNSIGIAAPFISSTFNNHIQYNNNHRIDDICTLQTASQPHSNLSISSCSPTTTHNSNECFNSLYSQHHASTGSLSQLNDFIDGRMDDDVQFNGINISNLHTKNISVDVMDTVTLFLKEHGNQYIKQFMQVKVSIFLVY